MRLSDSPAVLARTIDAIRREQVVRRAAWEADRPRGVRFGGLDPEPFYELTEAEIEAQARQRLAGLDAFRASPRGRFLKAIKRLEEASYDQEVYAARAAYSRGFADDSREADVAAVAGVIRLLAEIPSQDARTAVAALAELLQGEVRRAA